MATKYWETTHRHAHPWETVASTYWRRYPNPNSGHVFSEDFIETSLLNRNLLYTKRFITKTNSLPSWGRHFFSTKRVPMIEETVVDARERTMTTYTRNIGLRYFMGVTEKVVFRPDPLDEKRATSVRKEVWIESEVFGFQSAIRKFGVDRFKKNSVLATDGFEWVLDRSRFQVESQPQQSVSQGKRQHVCTKAASDEGSRSPGGTSSNVQYT